MPALAKYKLNTISAIFLLRNRDMLSYCMDKLVPIYSHHIAVIITDHGMATLSRHQVLRHQFLSLLRLFSAGDQGLQARRHSQSLADHRSDYSDHVASSRSSVSNHQRASSGESLRHCFFETRHQASQKVNTFLCFLDLENWYVLISYLLSFRDLLILLFTWLFYFIVFLVLVFRSVLVDFFSFESSQFQTNTEHLITKHSCVIIIVSL